MFSYAIFALLPLIVSSKVIDVQVGDANGTTAFSPEAVFADVGDVVRFTFHQKNHTATQSSLADPCGQLEGGFNSGFMPVAPGQTDNLPQYEVTVKDTKPIWVHCAQKNPKSHCGLGMVFAVNCGQDGAPNSFSAFKAAAEATLNATSAPSNPYGSPTDAAPPSSITIPPAPPVETVTATVTLGSEVWTTTYGSYPNSPAPTPASADGNTIKVIVGDNGTLTFNPPEVKASPRDTIVFEFHSKNHTATQSTFANPCVHLNNATSGQVGFDSGFMPVAAGSSDFPTYSVTVNDTAPIWVYCRQANHCGQGMVFAVNADDTSARSFSAYQTLAKEINGTNNAVAGNTTNTTSAGNPATSQTAGNAAVRVVVANAFGIVGVVGLLMALL